MLGSMGQAGSREGPQKEAAPTELNTANYGNFLKVSKDKLSVQYTGKGSHTNDVGAIQANNPVPSDRLIYYYEMTVKDAGERGVVAIGFAEQNFRLSRHPGWEPNSYGYHGDDGLKFHASGKGDEYGPCYGTGDTVGAGIHLENQEIFFTKNGKRLATAYQNVKGTLYPTVGLHSQGESVEINFGAKPFQFDLEGMVAEEREHRASAVLVSEIPTSIPHDIVCTYLKHYGYADTLASFDEHFYQQHSQSTSMNGNGNAHNGEKFGLEDRKKIRSLLFEGKVQEVKDMLDNKDPTFSDKCSHDFALDAYFHLCIQHFIEFIRLDKPKEAVQHAQASLKQFRNRSRKHESLIKDAMALLAYKDPQTSPMGYLMSTSQREAVADIIIAGILQSSGNADVKDANSSKSVLEKLLIQLCRVQAEIRRSNENKGEYFKLSDYTDS